MAVASIASSEAAPRWAQLCRAEMDKLDASEIGVVECGETLLEIMGDADLVYTMNIHPRQVGFDTSNRKIMAADIPDLMNDIFEVGWVWSECAHAVCAEEAPGSTAVEKYNKEAAEGSTILAPIECDSIKFGSLACSHNNAGLRAINARMPCDTPKMSEDGKYDPEKIARQKPKFGLALSQGLKWTVIRWPIRLHVPRALDIVQKARNTCGNIQRKIDAIEVMEEMHTTAAKMQKEGKEPDWPFIKRAALRTKPPCAPVISEMVVLLAMKSGGADGGFFKEFASFYRAFIKSHLRELPGSILGSR